MKHNQEGAIYQIFVAVLLVLVAAMFFTFWKINQTGKIANDIQGNTAPESSSPLYGELNEPSDPEGWVEYVDEASGVSFFHPPEWTPEATGSLTEETNPGKGIRRSIAVVGYNIDDNQGIHINIEPLDDQIRSIDFLLSNTLKETSNVQPIIISGFEGVRYEWQSEVNESAYNYPDPHKAAEFDSKMFRISIIQGYNYGDTDIKYANEFEEIISTLTI